MNQKKAPCTVVLIAVNTAVFLALSVIGMTEDAGFMLQHGAMYAPDILYNGKYYELFTSLFLHFGFQHLMSNMISLLPMLRQILHILHHVYLQPMIKGCHRFR